MVEMVVVAVVVVVVEMLSIEDGQMRIEEQMPAALVPAFSRRPPHTIAAAYYANIAMPPLTRERGPPQNSTGAIIGAVFYINDCSDLHGGRDY